MKFILISLAIIYFVVQNSENAQVKPKEIELDIKYKSLPENVKLTRRLRKRAIVTNATLCHCSAFETDCNGNTICKSDCNGLVRDAHEVDCKFPFTYNGVIYDICTDVDKGYFWCSLDKVYNNSFAKCEQACPLLARQLTAKLPDDTYTMCRPKPANATSKYPTDAEIAIILAQHNGVRSNVSEPAANLLELTWDHGLARSAMRLSEFGRIEHDCFNCKKLLNNRTVYVGQNVFGSDGRAWSSTYWEYAVRGWYSEISNYKYGIGALDGKWYNIGHYSQLVSSAASRIGCGAAVIGTRIVATCNYAFGQGSTVFPYENGTSCSSCAPGNCVNNLCRCHKLCQNYGTLDPKTCTCKCKPYATGPECENLICNGTDKSYGCWNVPSSWCTYSNIYPDCPHMCGTCDYIDYQL